MIYNIINLDLLSVGLTVAGIAVLGFTIYFSNPKSITGKSFLLFSIVSVFWGIVNYLGYKLPSETEVLWMQRLVIFSATWHAFSLLQLIYVFPKEKVAFPKKYLRVFLPIVVIVSLLMLTPLAFVSVASFDQSGGVPIIQKGPGMIPFLLLTIFNLIAAFYILIKKTNKAKGREKKQLVTMFLGLLITFFFLATFNFLLPALLDNVTLVPLGALFIFPFVAFTFYAIFRQGLLNVKVVTAEILTFVLAIVSFIEIVISKSILETLLRSSIFLLVLVFGILLIRGVLKEVEQREKIEQLAADLELANERQEGLIHFISHQIKGYLTKSKAAFSGILEGDYGPTSPVMNSMVKMALADNQQGVETIISILSASNLKKGTTTYKRESFDLKKAVEEQVSSSTAEAKKKGLTLETLIDPRETFTVIGDPEQIGKHVIGNLIDNSIKYTLKGGLKIGLAKKDGKVLFSVKDTGIGISEDDKKRLFTEGGRGKDSTKVNVNSTGYGLYIAKQIVEAHKGRIWVESAGSRKGSTFFVELPTM